MSEAITCSLLLILLWCHFSTGKEHEESGKRPLSVLIVTLPVPGHVTPAATLGEELVRRGHNVTLCTTAMEGSNIAQKKAKEAGINFMSAGQDFMTYSEYQQFAEVVTGNWTWTKLWNMTMRAISFLPEVSNRIGKYLDKSGMKNVDVIVSTELVAPLTACLSKKWNIPAVVLSTTLQFHPHHLPPWPYPPHMVYKRGTHRTSDNLSFLGRFLAVIVRPLVTLSWRFFLTINSLEFECPITHNYAELFPGIYAPHIVPTVIGFEYPRPSSPLTHYVGALVSKTPQTISAELKNWLDTKPERTVIYISMGSVAQFSDKHGEMIVNAMKLTGYSVIWSLREANQYILEGLEIDKEHFRIMKWVPQLAVLQHKAIAMAILHGGMNGVNEAIYCGVPLITVPFMNDQGDVSARVHHQGVGIQLLRNQLTTENLVASIKAIESGKMFSLVDESTKLALQCKRGM